MTGIHNKVERLLCVGKVVVESMKKGINIWSFRAQPLREAFCLAKQAGYEGVELAIAESGEINLESTEEEMRLIKSQAEEAGIELYSVATTLYWKYLFTSSDPQIRSKAIAIAKKQIEVAAWLGCDTVLVVPGAVGVDFIPDCELVDYDVAYERALVAMKELAPYAEEKKVAIAIENVGNRLLMSPLEVRDFIDRVNSPFVGAYFDVGNILRNGYPEQWIRILGTRIKKIHIKDFKKASNSFVNLMEGDVNFPAVMAALEQIGYCDWITAEVGPLYKYYPDMLLYTTSLAMDRIMKESI